MRIADIQSLENILKMQRGLFFAGLVFFVGLVLANSASLGFGFQSWSVVEIANAQDLCADIEDSLVEVSEIRSLPIRKKVVCITQSKQEVLDYLKQSIEHDIPAARMTGEEVTLKMVGFIPSDYNYVSGLIELYTGQLGGYYDPKKKRYVMADWMPDMLQKAITIHELTHVLQDEFYNLEKFVDNAKHTTDILSARSALLEGDAMAVMLDHSRRLVGQAAISEKEDVSDLIFQNVLGASFSFAGSAAPKSLQMQLLFPYSSGLSFVHSIIKGKGYQALGSVYQNPPNTTAEILHPDLYWREQQTKGGIFKRLSSPLVDVPVGAKLFHSDTMGEFFLASLLGLGVSPREASRAAEGWRGDRLELYKSGVDAADSHLLRWDLLWENEAEQREFCRSFMTLYRGRVADSGSKDALDDSEFRGSDGRYTFRITCLGEKVSLRVEGK